ncbi:hypothetical protein [sulfur-oxidizing endosymbiont of Gigantopelta aegis]|nr:hypothetical protein [sulfur-oxidizing endosymbiont of Gigantopelta aegis]
MTAAIERLSVSLVPAKTAFSWKYSSIWTLAGMISSSSLTLV